MPSALRKIRFRAGNYYCRLVPLPRRALGSDGANAVPAVLELAEDHCDEAVSTAEAIMVEIFLKSVRSSRN
jgi:hypothetical protein